MDAVFLGVDGGGTKTRFTLIDGAGRVLAESQLGTTYHLQIGLERVHAVLSKGVSDVLAQAGIGAEQIRHAFFGIPAYGEDSQVDPVLHALPEAILGHSRYACGNDMICGWAGSLGCADGINIVAGTGSIAYGERRGNGARAGGWGELFSDEGSSYWIAIRGLNAFTRMSDGRMPKGPLHAMLRAHFALDADLDICARLMGSDAVSRDRVAQMSRIVAAAANDGDVAARAIFEDAANELADIVEALRVTLGFEPGENIAVSYSGGAFSAGELLLQPFRNALQRCSSDFALQAPLHAPHIGAAMYAAKLAGHAIERSHG